MPRICLLALIGLPAAGKTSLSNWLLKQDQASLGSWNILHLCYDDYFVAQSIDNDYREQRNYIYDLLSQLMDTLKSKDPTELPQKLRRATQTINNGNYLIICDDNHYYRSMRYKLYQLCRLKSCVYAQIYIDRSLESCLQANEARGLNIPSAVIQQMHARLELPSDNAWELNSLTLNHTNFDAEFIAICEFMKSLVQCQIDDQPKALVKQTQLQSLVHQLDLLLRSRIQIQMQETNSTQTLPKSVKSRALNEKRKQILAQFRKSFNDNPTAFKNMEYYVNLLN